MAAHHGSLARRIRLDAEERLKSGALRVLVATASLELGIDIGSVDLVCQIGSPRSIGVGLQRIGRAGHWRGAVPKGRLFPTTLDDLVECAALVRAIRDGDLDRLMVPDAPLDILAQQIVAMCAAEEWLEDDLYRLVTRAYPYRDLTRAEFDEVLEMLAHGIAAKRGRYGAYLHRDRVNGRVRGRRGSRITAITAGGAIPDNALYAVVAEPDGTPIGTVDEDFAVESLAGDVMLLGNTSWRIRRVTSSGRVLVEDAHGAAPTIPFWRGEAPGRTTELSQHVAALRQTISDLAPDAVADGRGRPQAFGRAAPSSGCIENGGVDRGGAEQITDYLVVGSSRARRRAARSPPSSPSGSSTKAAGCSSSSTRRSARASTRRGAWRCASASAGRSTSSCRRPRPTTASTSRSPSNTASRSPTSSSTCIRPPRRRCSSRRRSPRRSSDRDGAGTPAVHSRCCACATAARCRCRFSGCSRTTCSHRCSRTSPRARRTSKATSRFPITRSYARS